MPTQFLFIFKTKMVTNKQTKFIVYLIILVVVSGTILVVGGDRQSKPDNVLSNPFNFNFNSKPLKSKIVIIKYFGQCKGKQNLPIYLPEFQIIQKTKNNYIMNGQIIIKENFPKNMNDFRATIDIMKCPDMNFILETCSPIVTKIYISDVCGYMNSDFMQTLLFHDVSTRPHCPMEKGVLELKNITVSTEMVKFMPTSSTQNYANQFIMSNKNGTIVGCVRLHLSIRTRRG